MSKPTDALRFDMRTIERNIRQGILTRKEVQEYLDSLPDVANKGVTLGEVESQQSGASSRES